MSSVRIRELDSGFGGVAGRSEALLVVHSAAAWRRLVPLLPAYRADWASLSVDWPRSVLLVVQTDPSDENHTFRVASVTRSGDEVEVRVEPVGPAGGEVLSTVQAITAKLLVVEAEAAGFSGAARVRVTGAGGAAVAQER
jgi:hypothetical protein